MDMSRAATEDEHVKALLDGDGIQLRVVEDKPLGRGPDSNASGRKAACQGPPSERIWTRGRYDISWEGHVATARASPTPRLRRSGHSDHGRAVKTKPRVTSGPPGPAT